jgi:acyl-homoserine-lactone acylase
MQQPSRLLLATALAVATAGAQPAAPATHAYDVRILRETFGVAHVRGRTDRDAAYGLAWAHAEDDFGNIERIFLASRGAAGRAYGRAGAPSDFLLAFLDARRTVEARYDSDLDSATKALLAGYTDGLNDYAAAHPEDLLRVTRRLLPVTPQDIVTGFVLTSPLFYGLDAVLGSLIENTPFPVPPPDERGSNGFVVAPARSGDGITRLVSNSHQPWTGPLAWYEASVHSDEGWDFAGALFPGSPVPLLGHNRTLGWTNTVNAPDLVDVYQLTVRDSAGGRWYRMDGEWKPLTREVVRLRVRIAGFTIPVKREIFRSEQGPVLRTDRGFVAVRYAGIGDVRQVMEYYRLTKARDLAEWRAALALQSVPATNFVYADAKGHIAYVYNGLFPRRRAGFDWAGVVPGDTSATLWDGYLPFDSVPQLIDPGSGFLLNSNNTPFRATDARFDLQPSAFPEWMGIEPQMTNRAVRALELLTPMTTIPRDSLLRVKYDAGYSMHSWMGPRLRDALATDTTGDQRLADAVRLLAAWDGVLADDRPASALGTILAGEWVAAKYGRYTAPPAAQSVRTGARALMRTFGRLDPPLGEFVRLRRGALDLPLGNGGGDVLRAVHSRRGRDGRLVGSAGDSFLMVVEWDASGAVHSESIQPFGAAAGRPTSAHYADQAPLFAVNRLKPVPFTEAAQRAMLEREYRPGITGDSAGLTASTTSGRPAARSSTGTVSPAASGSRSPRR